MKRSFVWLLVVAAVGIYFFNTKHSNQDVKIAEQPIPEIKSFQPAEMPPTEVGVKTDIIPSKIPTVAETTATPVPISARPRLKQVTPSLDTVREEVANDPHNTPPSLIHFSLDLGERMDAVKNEADASELFRELEDCLVEDSENRTRSIQALCLLNARRLSLKYVTLKKSYVALMAKADPKVVELSNQIN